MKILPTVYRSWRGLVCGAVMFGMAGLVPLAVGQSSKPGIGAILTGSGAGRTTTFRVWAPNAQKVTVRGDFNNWKDTELKPDPAHPGYWSTDMSRPRHGDAYQFWVDGNPRRDPRARWVDHERNVGFIYDTTAFKWGDTAHTWKMPPRENLVMYEMHMGTFNAGGNDAPFERAIKRIPYLLALGVNCIQLMPINEFPGQHSWGYNPVDLYAIESSYGGPDGFKAFVKACHENGIAVLLDIVHNHYGPDNIAVWRFDNWYKDDAGGIYFYNDRDRALTEWGPRPDYSRAEVRSFIVDSVKMFLEEYRVDGFRWDSVYNILYYQDGAHNNDDGKKVLAEANAYMKKNFPNALRIAEDHAFDYAIDFQGQWHSKFQTTISSLVCAPDKADMRAVADELLTLRDWNWVVFAECHDSAGNLNSHHRLPAYIDPQNPKSAKAQSLSLMANGIAMTVPGMPMFLQGLEMHDVDDFSDHTPIRWGLVKTTYPGIVKAHSDLIQLRRNAKGYTPGLQGTDIKINHVDNKKKVIAYNRKVKNLTRDNGTFVVLNFSDEPLNDYNLRFPSPGTWYCHFNSGSAIYSKDFDNLGPKPGDGIALAGNQTVAPLKLSRRSMLIFSQSAPPNARVVRAGQPTPQQVQELEPLEWMENMMDDDAPRAPRQVKAIEFPPFPYTPIPLP